MRLGQDAVAAMEVCRAGLAALEATTAAAESDQELVEALKLDQVGGRGAHFDAQGGWRRMTGPWRLP